MKIKKYIESKFYCKCCRGRRPRRPEEQERLKMKKEELRMNNKDKQSVSDQIEGRNSVLELLESNRDINKIFIARGERHGSINKIIAKAKERKIVIVEVERQKLNAISETENHQGVIAIVPPFNYCEVEDILEEAKSKNEERDNRVRYNSVSSLEEFKKWYNSENGSHISIK